MAARHQRPWYRRAPRWFARDTRPNRADYAAAARDGGTWRFAVIAAGAAIVLLGIAQTFVDVAGVMFWLWALMAVIGAFQGSAELRARDRRISG
jgi:hypothetical protein